MKKRATMSRSEIRDWLTAYLSQLLGISPSEVDTSSSFELYGVDSTAAVGLSGDLGELLGRELDTSLAYDHPSIDSIVEHLVAEELVTA